jgi:hypothetical protein
MEKAREIGNIALWLCGHLAFTIIINLTAVGGYYCYKQYQDMMPVQIDLAQLNEQEKEALAQALVEDGFNVPREKKKG